MALRSGHTCGSGCDPRRPRAVAPAEVGREFQVALAGVPGSSVGISRPGAGASATLPAPQHGARLGPDRLPGGTDLGQQGKICSFGWGEDVTSTFTGSSISPNAIGLELIDRVFDVNQADRADGETPRCSSPPCEAERPARGEGWRQPVLQREPADLGVFGYTGPVAEPLPSVRSRARKESPPPPPGGKGREEAPRINGIAASDRAAESTGRIRAWSSGSPARFWPQT